LTTEPERPWDFQLYMWSRTRQKILERHAFYVQQVKERVLSRFQDIEAEAKAHADIEYEHFASLPAPDDIDMSDLAEAAYDRGLQFYFLLHDLKKQMALGALAGMYHQWEKELREFIERELANDMRRDRAAEIAWGPPVPEVFNILEQFKWNFRRSVFFLPIDACRLIVNVYKHGKGPSLEKLAASYPGYLSDPVPLDQRGSAFTELLDHEWLSISEVQFDEIAAAIRQFWEEFPERLFLKC
jgi:hypothetical protein